MPRMSRLVRDAVLTALRTASEKDWGELPTSSMTFTTPPGTSDAMPISPPLPRSRDARASSFETRATVWNRRSRVSRIEGVIDMAKTQVRMSEKQRTLFEEPNFAHLATVRRDGSPHVAPVWVDVRDGTIIVNTARGRVKERNVEHDRRVALSVTDRKNPYRMVSLTGRVTRATEEGADEHIDVLAKKYLGKDRYPNRAPNERRVILEIEPESISGMGV